MTARVALYLQDFADVRRSIGVAQQAEARGFEAIWQADRPPHGDALTSLGALAASTTQLILGAAPIMPWARDPAGLAAALLTLDDLAPGRVRLAFGIGDPAVNGNLPRRDRPLIALRETVTAVRDRLSARRIPIYLAATGLKTCALAGEIADGVLLNYLVSPEYTARAVEAIGRGAQVGGRAIDAIDRPQLILTSIDFDRRHAFDRLRPLVAQVLAAYPALMRACGAPPDLLEEIRQVMTPNRRSADPAGRAEAIDRAATIVPDEVISELAAVGTPSEVRARVESYRAAGCTCPVLAAPGGDFALLIDTFATR